MTFVTLTYGVSRQQIFHVCLAGTQQLHILSTVVSLVDGWYIVLPVLLFIELQMPPAEFIRCKQRLLSKQVSEVLSMVNDPGLSRHLFFLNYQPQLSLCTHDIG